VQFHIQIAHDSEYSRNCLDILYWYNLFEIIRKL